MKLVLIGGGNYGVQEDLPYNLKEIDEKIVSLSNKAHPRLLFIGFTERSNYYYSFIKRNFMNLGCQCEYLKYDEFDNQKTVDGKFKRADILYLGGGNTLFYMKQIKKFGLDKKIVEFAEQGKVIAGLSAGSIICCSLGMSDSRNYQGKVKYTCVKGLGLLNLVYVPHYQNSNRPDDIERFMSYKKKMTAICCDECAAFVVEDDKFSTLKTNENSKVFKCKFENKILKQTEIKTSGNLLDLI